MKSYEQFIKEDISQIKKEPSGLAAKEAKRLGLSYYGFGRYGKNGKTSHVVIGQALKPVDNKAGVTNPRDAKNQKVVDHSKGLTRDKDLTKQKNEKPDQYKKIVGKASEKLKVSDQKRQDDEQVYGQLDQTEPQFQEFLKGKEKESDETHKKLRGHYDWRGLSDEEKKTLVHFNDEGFQEINPLLASDEKIRKNTSQDKYVTMLDGIMAKTETPFNFYAYAAFNTKDVLETHKQYIIPEFRSSTTNLNIAVAYLQNEQYKSILQFKIRKGQQGFYMDGNNSEATDQGMREFLLPRGTKFEVTDDPQMISINNDEQIAFYQCVITDDNQYSIAKN